MLKNETKSRRRSRGQKRLFLRMRDLRFYLSAEDMMFTGGTAGVVSLSRREGMGSGTQEEGLLLVSMWTGYLVLQER